MYTAWLEERMVPGLLFSSEYVPQVKWPLCFIFSYLQPITQRNKRTLQEGSLQSIQLQQKLPWKPSCSTTMNQHLALLQR